MTLSTEARVYPRCLVAFATGWGADFGGINVFNVDFLQNLSFACQGQASIVCVVPSATAAEIADAWKYWVHLVPLPFPPAGTMLDASHAGPAVEELDKKGFLSDPAQLVWLGHDRITGEIALAARDQVGGRAALIHHMSYTHYEAFADSAVSANAKAGVQKALFKRADVLFAIGPLLRDALRDMVLGREVTALVPGLQEIEVLPAPNTFTGFMSGRLSADAAKIKQGHVGVAAFADAHKRAQAELGLPHALRNQPRLVLRGADLEAPAPRTGQPDTTYWLRYAEQVAGRVVNVQALPYTAERQELLEELASATVALMPSWHEGFGLAGWEAVAAGVPLIVSEKSGLYQLLNEESDGAWVSWVYPVDILGTVDEPYFREEDLRRVSERLLEIARDPEGARHKARRLREALRSRFSWKHCVDSALASLHWASPKIEVALPQGIGTASLVQVAATQAPEPLSPLELPQPRWDRHSGLAESQLLRAEEAAVPFDPEREPDLDKLLQWAYDADLPTALRLITGSGGTGKTRLALELCARLGEQGWRCGLLPSETGAPQAAAAWATLAAQSEPTLVVFDYAETRQDTLISFLRAVLMPGAEVKPRTRILLLARDGGEWWDRLPARDPLCEPFLSGYATSGPFALPPLHSSLSRRETAYQTAVAAYAARLGLEQVPSLGGDLAGEHFGRPLFVQMAAVLALRGERPASAEGLTKALLHHERRYWSRLLKEPLGTVGLAELDDRHAAELMALATLAGGFARPADTQKVWCAWSGSAGGELVALRQRALFERLAPLYPGQQGLQPLRPDLLGEALVAHSLLQDTGERLLDALLGAGNSNSQRQNALTVVARLSNHRPDVEAVVVESLTRQFASCAADVVNVASQSDSRLPDWAVKAFSRLPFSIQSQVGGVLMPLLEHESLQLAELACVVSLVDVEKSRKKVERKPDDITLRAGYARALSNHAVDLKRAGRDGRTAARQSVDLFEKLANRNASRFEAGWATSLMNYASHLAAYGQYAEALVRANQALESLERLAIKDPDQFQAEWLAMMSNYANHLADSGQYAEALSRGRAALEVYEKLAAKDADRFEADWATSLIDYASRLSENGRYEEALSYARKATDIRRKLAAENVDRFQSDWATSLNNAASYLADNGKYTEALSCANTAREIVERLAVRMPLRFGEKAYLSLLNVRWFEWLVDSVEVDDVETAPEPDLTWCKPHRLPVLRVYRAWVQACSVAESTQRPKCLAEVLRMGTGLNLGQFRHIEPYWLCAAAWCAAHAPDSEPVAPWSSQWLLVWERFVAQRGANLPCWMNEVAQRMSFVWPNIDPTVYTSRL